MKKYFSYRIVTAFFVLILVWAVVSYAEITNAGPQKLDENTAMRMSYETIETMRSNTDLVQEIEQLKAKQERYLLSLKDKNKIRQELEDKKSQYEIINGVQKVQGRGVEISVNGALVTEEMTDLINGIRNAKPLAIGINNRRVSYRSYFVVDSGVLEFDNQKYSFPLTIQVIGDQDALHKSLDRSGGILDVITKNSFGKASFQVETKDSLELPAYDKSLQFYYAKIAQ